MRVQINTTVVYFFRVLTFKFVSEILKSDQSDKSYCTVLSCGAVYFAM